MKIWFYIYEKVNASRTRLSIYFHHIFGERNVQADSLSKEALPLNPGCWHMGVTFLPDHLHRSEDLARVSFHITHCWLSDQCKWLGGKLTPWHMWEEQAGHCSHYLHTHFFYVILLMSLVDTDLVSEF